MTLRDLLVEPAQVTKLAVLAPHGLGDLLAGRTLTYGRRGLEVPALLDEAKTPVDERCRGNKADLEDHGPRDHKRPPRAG